MPTTDIRNRVHQFIQKNYLFDAQKKLSDDDSLLGSGVVDSTGILELIGFLEENYNVKFADHELVGENFDSVSRISSFISSKVALGQ